MKGKPHGALVALLAAGRPKAGGGEEDEEDYDQSEDDEMGEGLSEHDSAFASLANAMGIPEEKRGSAKAALKQFVRACMREYGSEEE